MQKVTLRCMLTNEGQGCTLIRGILEVPLSGLGEVFDPGLTACLDCDASPLFFWSAAAPRVDLTALRVIEFSLIVLVALDLRGVLLDCGGASALISPSCVAIVGDGCSVGQSCSVDTSTSRRRGFTVASSNVRLIAEGLPVRI